MMQHMVENSGAASVRFTPAEVSELNSAVRAIEGKGQRLPDVQCHVDLSCPGSRWEFLTSATRGIAQ